jgi:hypothetical protein
MPLNDCGSMTVHLQFEPYSFFYVVRCTKSTHGSQKMGIIAKTSEAQPIDLEDNGEVAERLNAPVLKTGVPSQEP